MSMAIALTPRDQVAGHFGKAAAFAVYDQHGQFVIKIENAGSRELGCKHKKVIQRQLAEYGVSEIVLGNIGQRSLARLLNAGFKVSRVAPRTALNDVLTGSVDKEVLTSAEQGRDCKREKGACGCGCGSKKKAPVAKVGMSSLAPMSGLAKIGGFKL
ncbi:NifB/NifX family molybdenum-iron cluster-binding protein [Photobacterium leiognathi]|uniref:NifB/NifX family molybdenum-iron cluster-binding protein n=1 Tax=Photobacterium leiognathi TaxID=553611 RepID=UPI002981456E|nr:NifB/NifX family molybdenum-iron cluster-binding protein [Photobacterium leiognathi]